MYSCSWGYGPWGDAWRDGPHPSWERTKNNIGAKSCGQLNKHTPPSHGGGSCFVIPKTRNCLPPSLPSSTPAPPPFLAAGFGRKSPRGDDPFVPPRVPSPYPLPPRRFALEGDFLTKYSLPFLAFDGAMGGEEPGEHGLFRARVGSPVDRDRVPMALLVEGKPLSRKKVTIAKSHFTAKFTFA